MNINIHRKEERERRQDDDHEEKRVIFGDIEGNDWNEKSERYLSLVYLRESLLFYVSFKILCHKLCHLRDAVKESVCLMLPSQK